MKMKFGKHSDSINAEAADWFTLVESGCATEQQRRQLEEWLAIGNEHRDAYQQLSVIWADLAELSGSEEGASLRQSVEKGSISRFFAELGASAQHLLGNFGLRPQLALALSTVAIICSILYLSQPMLTSVEVYATRIGEIKTITLIDGSQVTLGANSAIEAWSDDSGRHVVLNAGQAFFVVTTDPERPFWVEAEDTRVKVVGTKFDVRNSQDRVRVAVLEGVVNVAPVTGTEGAGNTPVVVLRAGQQVIKPRANDFQPVKPISEHELSAWRRGRLVYLDASIVDVIGDANRYFDGTIVLEGGDLSDLRVTAAIRTDQVAFLPDMLAQSLPIVVQKSGDNRIVLSPREEQPR